MKTSIQVGKNHKPNLFKVIVLSVCLLSGITVLHAQTPAVFDDPGGETGGDGNGSFGDGPVVPLDGGMSIILLAGGIGYVGKRLKNNLYHEK